MRGFAVLVLALSVANVLGHGWLQAPKPSSGGGPTQENASTQSPCGKLSSLSTQATYAQGQTFTATSMRGGGHGEGAQTNSVQYKLSMSGYTAADFEVDGVNTFDLGTFPYATAGQYNYPLTLPAGVFSPSGVAAGQQPVLQFHWTTGDGGNWWDCAFIEIADANDFCAPTANWTCATNAECFNLVPGPGYDCACAPGYEGTDAKVSCTNIDECANLDPCDPRASCEDGVGDFTCSCEGTYMGDGTRNYCWALLTVRMKVFALDFNEIEFADNIASMFNIPSSRVTFYLIQAGEDFEGSPTTSVQFTVAGDGVTSNGDAETEAIYQAAIDGDASFFNGYEPVSVQMTDAATYDRSGDLCPCGDSEGAGKPIDPVVFIAIGAVAGGLLLIAAVGAGVWYARKHVSSDPFARAPSSMSSSTMPSSSTAGGYSMSPAPSRAPVTDNYSYGIAEGQRSRGNSASSQPEAPRSRSNSGSSAAPAPYSSTAYGGNNNYDYARQ